MIGGEDTSYTAGHFVYCTEEQRLGTYKVLRWLEDNYEQCKAINADTPVEYHTLDDLQFGQVTESLLPKFIRRGTPSEKSIISEVSDSGIPTGGQVYHTAHLENIRGPATLLWISENTPAEMVYAVTGTAADAPQFPTTIGEAKNTPYWPLVKDALESEIKGEFIDNRAWDVVPRSSDRKVVKSTWVLRFFVNDDRSIAKVKAR